MRSFKLLKNIILSVMMLALPMGLLAQSNLKQILERGELRVGTTGDWNPMTLIDPATQKREGFDIDVATAWLQTWASRSFLSDHLEDPGQRNRRRQVRHEHQCISQSQTGFGGGIFKSYFAVVDVPLMNRNSAGKYNSWEDLNSPSVTVAVTMGTVRKKEPVRCSTRPRSSPSLPRPGYQEVLAGRADASMTSNLEAANLVKKYKQLQRVPVQEGRSPPRWRCCFPRMTRSGSTTSTTGLT